MPKRKRPAQFGIYYLSQRRNSPYWCRTWFDSITRQTKRESLGTEDLEEATDLLKSWFIKYGDRPLQQAEKLTIAEAALRYYAQHGQHLKGAGAGVQARNLEIAIEHVGELTVAEFKRDKQEKFARELSQKYRPATIRRIFDAVFAALNRARQCEELESVPPRIRLPNSPPREFVATVDQLAAFWDAKKPPQLQMFFVLLLSTGARPSTVLELTRFQCDLEDRFIDLNPPGRVQTRKRRPVIPMCSAARDWIATADNGPLVHYHGRPISYPNRSWRRVRREAGLPEAFTPGAMRHTVASELYRRDVPETQISEFLGHAMPRRISEGYVKRRPRFMAETIEALDAFFEEIAQRSETSFTPMRVSGVLTPRLKSVPNSESHCKTLENGGRGWVRTSDPYGVNVVLSH